MTPNIPTDEELPALPEPAMRAIPGTGRSYDIFTASQLRTAQREELALGAAQGQQEPAWRDKVIIAKETVVEIPGKRPQLGYTVLAEQEIFDTHEQASAEMKALSLPLGWVRMNLRQLCTGFTKLAAQPAAPVAIPGAISIEQYAEQHSGDPRREAALARARDAMASGPADPVVAGEPEQKS